MSEKGQSRKRTRDEQNWKRNEKKKAKNEVRYTIFE